MANVDEIIAGLEILRGFATKTIWTQAEHDELYCPGPPPATYREWDDDLDEEVDVPVKLYDEDEKHMPEEAAKQLDELGWHWDADADSWRCCT